MYKHNIYNLLCSALIKRFLNCYLLDSGAVMAALVIMTIRIIDVHFPEENNTGLPPVLFHHHSPLHTLKVTDISVKLNHM